MRKIVEGNDTLLGKILYTHNTNAVSELVFKSLY
jgi:hypothetical protein